MGIVTELKYEPLVFADDPDDHRPNSRLAVVVDPGEGDLVDGMSVLVEELAPGDRIPLHTHTIEEVIFIDGGTAEVRLGDEAHEVSAGAIVFVPAGMPHGTRNTGVEPVALRAVFPSGVLTLRYLERNPAPGTEGDEPQRPVAIDVRAWVAGDPDAVRPLEA